jgi:hypothetical protein
MRYFVSYILVTLHTMTIVEVSTAAQAKQFLNLHTQLLKHEPNFIQPLDKDINDTFDKEKNKTFRYGEVCRWVLYNDANQPIGKIAAFINEKYKSKGDHGVVGGCGFFDCINDQRAANMLFETAKQWLQDRGAVAMDGPINFGERDKFWGLYIDGTGAPMYGMNFNARYYKNLFESYGFQLFFEQYCFGFDPQKPLSEKVMQRYQELCNNGDYALRTIEKSKLDKYAQDFATIYNKAWAGHGGLKQMDVKQVKKMFAKMKPIMDENIAYFAYYNDEPIGMFVNIPDLNQYFKYLHGKFGLLQKMKFLYLQKFKPSTRFIGLIFGVIPEFQGKGIDSFMIGHSKRIIHKKTKYKDYELQWIGDFNPKMIAVAKGFGDTYISKTYATYRYNFDRTIPFERHPIL